jgi:hypothetical protein
LNIRNPYFQIVSERNKNEHCRFCQSDVKLTYCDKCQEITKKQCVECEGYEDDNFEHICEVDFTGFMRE